MNTQLTEIAFILDQSGSMGSIAADAIDGFNSFVLHQQRVTGEARLTLALFNVEYTMPFDHLDIREIPPLTTETYVPQKSTALLDAIGNTIRSLGERLSGTPEEERPGTVIVAILTDGLENASSRFNWREVSAMIQHQTEVYSWEFLFLGANQDAIETAADLRIPKINAATCKSDGFAAKASPLAISRKVAAMREKAAGIEMCDASQADLAANMFDIVDEEDSKLRESKDNEL